MRVYRDFFTYRGGVYRHSGASRNSGKITLINKYHFDLFFYKIKLIFRIAFFSPKKKEPSGFHSVRLIGWGEERTGYEITKYWVSFKKLIVKKIVSDSEIMNCFLFF